MNTFTRSYKAAWVFYMKLNHFKDLKEDHLYGILGKEAKSDYVLQRNGLVVCMFLSHLQHTTERPSRKKWQ